jgi:hypothetical protein
VGFRCSAIGTGGARAGGGTTTACARIVRPRTSFRFTRFVPEVILLTFAAWPTVLRQPPASPAAHTVAPRLMLN